MYPKDWSDWSVVLPAFGSAHNLADSDVLNVPLLDNYVAYQVPLHWSLMHPGYFIFVSLVEDSVSDAQHVFSAHAQEKQTVAVEASYTMGAEYTCPVFTYFPNTCVEVTQDY